MDYHVPDIARVLCPGQTNGFMTWYVYGHGCIHMYPCNKGSLFELRIKSLFES